MFWSPNFCSSILLNLLSISTMIDNMFKTSTYKTLSLLHCYLSLFFFLSFPCLLSSPFLLCSSFFPYSHFLHSSLLIIYPLPLLFLFFFSVLPLSIFPNNLFLLTLYLVLFFFSVFMLPVISTIVFVILILSCCSSSPVLITPSLLYLLHL